MNLIYRYSIHIDIIYCNIYIYIICIYIYIFNIFYSTQSKRKRCLTCHAEAISKFRRLAREVGTHPCANCIWCVFLVNFKLGVAFSKAPKNPRLAWIGQSTARWRNAKFKLPPSVCFFWGPKNQNYIRQQLRQSLHGQLHSKLGEKEKIRKHVNKNLGGLATRFVDWSAFWLTFTIFNKISPYLFLV